MDYSKTVAGSPIEVAKDARDVSNILAILDSQPIKTNPFGANVTGENSYRRAERISAALHLITSHVPETEPLRASLRLSGLHLLNCILEMRTGFRSLASEKGQTALAAIRELISKVRLLAIAGYVSASNVSAVIEALDELGSLIGVSQRSTLAERFLISRNDLMPSSRGIARKPVRRIREAGPRRVRRVIKDVSLSDETTQSTSRTDQILDILRAGGVLGIKDISLNLPQYSEKMVQRELASLVRLNKVVKVGAKRWSRYQAVQ